MLEKRAAQATRVDDALKQLGIAPAIIVGHSFGAGAATELAMRYPERACSAVRNQVRASRTNL